MKTLSPAVITLPWRQDAAEFYFSRLSHLPWAMLLHSGYADHPYSRFDIVVAEPLCTLTTFGKETVVSESEKRTTTTDDPLQVLQQVLDRADIRPAHNEDLPFQGGALGLFGYDLGRRFESLPEIAEQDIVLPDMAVGIYDWALVVDHQRQTVSLLSHNDVNARRAWLESQQFSPQEDFTLTSDWQSNMTREQYGEKFRQVQEYLHSGDCYQVNLAQRFHATYSGDEWQAFLQLNQANRAPFSAFLRLEQGAILSLSPERFILCDNSEIQTRPIKGTLPRLPDPQEDSKQAEKLANSAKDRAENLMIVDLMRNDIGRVAVAVFGKSTRAVRGGTLPCRASSGQHHNGAATRTVTHQRSAARSFSWWLNNRGSESTGYGNYRRTGTAPTQCLVRQHWLFELLRQHGHQHYYPHADCH